MNNKIYTFWEGKMPDYLKLCLDTWHFDFVILNYENLKNYTDPIPEKLKQLALPKIADYVRVHVLRDNGGYWLDTDTILLNDELPKEDIFGYPAMRSNTIGFLNAKNNSKMYKEWAKYQEETVNKLSDHLTVDNTSWDVLGNKFTDTYVKAHDEIIIGDVSSCWPETYIVKDNISRPSKYQKFYFASNYKVKDLTKKTNILLLHNSWTPKEFKELSKNDILNKNLTFSNLIKAAL